MVVKDTNRQKRQIGTQKNEPEKRGDKQEEKYMHVRWPHNIQRILAKL